MKALQYYRLKSIANIINKLDPANTYTYDLYGRRIRKTVNGMVTNFLWDEDNISLELNENNQPIRRYVYGVGMDNVEGHFEYAEATSNPFATDKKGWYTYIKDQVGTIYKTFSHGTSQVVNSRAYDTFGNLISQSGTSKSPLGFQSKYFDQESGLYYFYNRYYSSNIGRFITGDPLGPEFDTNLYRFVWNNPISTTDPMGLAPVPYEPSECCKEKKTLEKRLKLVNFLIKYFSSTPPPTANPIHGPEGKELTPVGSSSGWTHPGLTKCEKRCVDIHEATPSHVNAGAMNFAAAELQGYTYEKLCLEYEMGIIHQWRWPFR